jgi:archaellum component FlaC
MDPNDFTNQDDYEDMDEDLENDLYLIELHKRLTNIKKDRKKAECDANLLDNRLKMLKGEEDKVSRLF